MEQSNNTGTAPAGQSRLLAIGILYFCTAGSSIFSLYAIYLWVMGLPFENYLVLTGITGAIFIVCSIAVLILVLNVGKRLERKHVMAAGFVALASIVATFALNLVYQAVRIPLTNQFIDAGLAETIGEPMLVEMYADSFTSGLISMLPLSIFPVLLSVCLLLDASKGGLSRVVPIVAIAVAGAGVGYNIFQVCLLWYGISFGFSIPFSQAAMIMWGVYFLVVRHSLT